MGSFASGFIIRLVGRPALFVFGALMNIIVIIVMLTWTPTVSTEWVVYILGAMWGVGDAIWQTQINALYGALFASDEEAAFSNYRLWESMGFVLAFITQACGVCVFPKIILTIVFLSIGMAGYFVVEFLEYKKDQEKRNS